MVKNLPFDCLCGILYKTCVILLSINITSLENALGQYILYQNIIEEIEPDRTLYLAVHEEVFLTVFEESLGRMIIAKNHLKLLIFNRTEEVIVKWNA